MLADEPGNAQALFRRGRARAALGQSEAAAADLEKAQAAAPEDGAIAKELAAVRQALKQVRCCCYCWLAGRGQRASPCSSEATGRACSAYSSGVA